MRTSRRFTLVELLVVIAIVAVLAGILLPTIGKAIVRARSARARTEMASLITAMKAYDGDYDLMPYGYDSADGVVPTSDYDVIISFLSQTGTTANKAEGNPRKTRFLNVKTPGEYLDPWNHQYVIVADFDANETLAKGLVAGLYDDGVDIPQSVVIWSKGPDGAYSSTPSDKVNKDNVYSIDTTWTQNGHVAN